MNLRMPPERCFQIRRSKLEPGMKSLIVHRVYGARVKESLVMSPPKRFDVARLDSGVAVESWGRLGLLRKHDLYRKSGVLTNFVASENKRLDLRIMKHFPIARPRSGAKRNLVRPPYQWHASQKDPITTRTGILMRKKNKLTTQIQWLAFHFVLIGLKVKSGRSVHQACGSSAKLTFRFSVLISQYNLDKTDIRTFVQISYSLDKFLLKQEKDY